VRRRRWLTHDEFLDLVGATNLIPGPNSTELAIHIGYRRAGWAGLLVAGACFIHDRDVHRVSPRRPARRVGRHARDLSAGICVRGGERAARATTTTLSGGGRVPRRRQRR